MFIGLCFFQHARFGKGEARAVFDPRDKSAAHERCLSDGPTFLESSGNLSGDVCFR